MSDTSKSPRKSAPKVLPGTPAQHGFTFPPEWAPHSATWFSWPRPEGISFPGRYHTVPKAMAAIIGAIAPREHVHINVPNENYERIVREQLAEHGIAKAMLSRRITFHHIMTNESWCRDHGPAFVVKGKKFAIVDWGFNAWGGKYPPYDSDDYVPTRIAEEFAASKVPGFAGVFYPRTKAGEPVIMEGGAVEFSGDGVVMTSEACLLNKNRNPKLSKKQIEGFLKDYYGQRHVLWLGDGIVGDDTDGHIDDLARFIGPRTIVTTVEEDPKDENYKILRDNLRRLELAKHPDGGHYEIVTIPMPGVVEIEGQRVPATYANFYFVNGALLVPIYKHKANDKRCLRTLAEALDACGHKREVVGIDCSDLIWGLGAIHCLSQQQPRI